MQYTGIHVDESHMNFWSFRIFYLWLFQMHIKAHFCQFINNSKYPELLTKHSAPDMSVTYTGQTCCIPNSDNLHPYRI